MFKTYGTINETVNDLFDSATKYNSLEQLSGEDYAHYVDIGRPIRNLYENEYEMYLQFQSLFNSTVTYNYGILKDAIFGNDFLVTSSDIITVSLDTAGTQHYLRMPTGLALTQDGTFFVNKPRIDILERQLFKILEMYDKDKEYVQIKYDTASSKYKIKVSKIYLYRATSVSELVKVVYFGCADEAGFANSDYSSGYTSSIKMLEAIYNFESAFFDFEYLFGSYLSVDPDLSKLICEPVVKITADGTYYWKIDASGNVVINTVAPTTNEIGVAKAVLSSFAGTFTDIRKFFTFKNNDAPKQSNLILYSDFDNIDSTLIKSNYTDDSFAGLEFSVANSSYIENAEGVSKNGTRIVNQFGSTVGIQTDLTSFAFTPTSGINISFYLKKESSALRTPYILKLNNSVAANLLSVAIDNSTGVLTFTPGAGVTFDYWAGEENKPTAVVSNEAVFYSFNIYTTSQLGALILSPDLISTIDSVYIFRELLSVKNVAAFLEGQISVSSTYTKNVKLTGNTTVDTINKITLGRGGGEVASNVAVGVNALSSNTAGIENTAFGTDSLKLNTGSNNTAIGHGAGEAITSGSNNTIVGNYPGTSALVNNVVLADGSGNVKLRIDENNAATLPGTVSGGGAPTQPEHLTTKQYVDDRVAGAPPTGFNEGNFRFDTGVAGWTLYNDGALDHPVDGTGGTANLITLVRETVSPLIGIGSGKLSKSANNAMGQGISCDFTVDRAPAFYTMTLQFDYQTGLNCSVGDIGVYIYDKVNNTLIPFETQNLAPSYGNPLRYKYNFVSNTAIPSYRVIFHIQSANTLAYDVLIDNIVFSVCDEPTSLSYDLVATVDGDYTIPTGVSKVIANSSSTINLTIPAGAIVGRKIDVLTIGTGIVNVIATSEGGTLASFTTGSATVFKKTDTSWASGFGNAYSLKGTTPTAFGLSLIDDAAATNALDTLGGTAVGKSMFTAINKAAQQALVAGSGLDADSVSGCGIGADAISAPNPGDFRTITKGGKYYYAGSPQIGLTAMSNGKYFCEHSNISNTYAVQWILETNYNRTYVCRKDSSAWGPCYEIWNATSDGNGSQPPAPKPNATLGASDIAKVKTVSFTDNAVYYVNGTTTAGSAGEIWFAMVMAFSAGAYQAQWAGETYAGNVAISTGLTGYLGRGFCWRVK